MLGEHGFVARGPIYPSRFVTISGANGVVQAVHNSRIIGVSQAGTNKPAVAGLIDAQYAAEAGQPVMVAQLGSRVKVEAGTAITAGQLLKSDGQGRAIPIGTTDTTIQNYGGIALESGAVDEKIEILVLFGSERPALA